MLQALEIKQQGEENPEELCGHDLCFPLCKAIQVARKYITHGPSPDVSALADDPPTDAASQGGVALAPAGVAEDHDFVQLGWLQGHSPDEAQRRQCPVEPETVEKLLRGNRGVLVGVV